MANIPTVWITQAQADDLALGAVSGSTWAKVRHRHEITYRLVGRTCQYDRASVLRWLDLRVVLAEPRIVNGRRVA